MRQFFYTAFGGLVAISTGILIAYGASVTWNMLSPKIAKVKIPSVSAIADSIASQPEDGTSISGLRRTIRFSASEEEDLISAAEQALPQKYDKKVTADSYIVRNLSRGFNTATLAEDKLLPIASLSKLVTAIVARKNMADDEKITITRDIMSTYGNTAGFKVGEIFTAKDLMYPLLMVSSNDAAEAYAQDFGRKKFIAAMNEFVQSIGAYRTYFADPSGLSPQNVSTASDLALILNWIRVNDPEIISITDLKSKTIRSHTFTNPTHFLNWSNYIGGKNGYTPEANRTGAALFTMGKAKDVYAVVILGSDSRDSDVVNLLAKIK